MVRMRSLLLKNRLYRKIICVLMMLPLLTGLLPGALPQAYAKENFDLIDLKQKLLIAQVGDKYEMTCYGVYHAKVLGSPIDWYDDITGVTWKSSNTKVATVSKSGVVTAKSSGKCIITASYGKLTSQCKVRVYTKQELYNHILDADIAHESIYMALNSNYYKKMDEFFYATENRKEVAIKKVEAAKKVVSIIDTVITEDMSDYEKMMAITEWIFENIEVIKNYRSKFTKQSLYEYNKDYYYLDSLIYGKARHIGIGYLFELLMNCAGLRCELMYESCGSVEDCNIVELDGEYYYFNIVSLVYDLETLREERGKDMSFYDLFATENTMVDQFLNTTVLDENTYLEYELNPRKTNYSSSRMNYDVSLAKNLDEGNPYTYDHYFYDFYNDQIRFVSKKENNKNPHISVRPYFASLPGYPDSNSTKYKEIMAKEAEFNSKILQLETDTYGILDILNEGYDVTEDNITYIKESMAAIEAEFEIIKGSITREKFVTYLTGKIAEVKALVNETEAKYYR